MSLRDDLAGVLACDARYSIQAYAFVFCAHFLSGLFQVPSLSGHLPFDELVDLSDCLLFVNVAFCDCLKKQGVHVKLSALGTMLQKCQNSFEPAHELDE